MLTFPPQAIAYSILGLVFAILAYKYRHDLLTLQLWIALMICSGLVESLLLYGSYEYYNNTGVFSVALLVFNVLAGGWKRTASRYVLCISPPQVSHLPIIASVP